MTKKQVFEYEPDKTLGKVQMTPDDVWFLAEDPPRGLGGSPSIAIEVKLTDGQVFTGYYSDGAWYIATYLITPNGEKVFFPYDPEADVEFWREL